MPGCDSRNTPQFRMNLQRVHDRESVDVPDIARPDRSKPAKARPEADVVVASGAGTPAIAEERHSLSGNQGRDATLNP